MIGRSLAWGAGLVLLSTVATVPLGWSAQVAIGGLLFASAWLASKSRRKGVGLFLVALSLTATARYFFWRFGSTIEPAATPDFVAASLLLAAELYALAMLLIGYFQSLWSLERKPVPMEGDPSTWPTVDVFIPTYNEPLSVVRTTVMAAKALDWPREKLRIYLLDDGRRESFRAFAAQAKVGYIVRGDGRHAKAGNLNHALTRTGGEFIAIFDCDHVPARTFLQLTMGWFQRDRRLALVQTPHHFYSPDPFERNAGTFRKTPNEGELFYGLIQPVNDLWNAAFFCGSCAVLRRSALEEVGGIATETVTEDAHTALKLHRRGYRSAFLSVVQAAGLATESLSAHVGQRIRWARGMAQIFRVDNPLLGGGLTIGQRISYLGAMLHFFHGIPRIVFLVSPLFFLLLDLHIFHASPRMVLAHWAPHMALVILTNSRIQGKFRHSFWSDIYETCLSFYVVVPTTLALLAPKAGRFNVTAKGGLVKETFFDWRIAAPYLSIALLSVLGIVVGGIRLAQGGDDAGVLAINMGWTLLNLVVLFGTLAIAWERRQMRDNPRVPARLPSLVRLSTGRTLHAEVRDLSMGGARVSVPEVAGLGKGERVWVSVLGRDEERALPARIVRKDADGLGLRWDPLSMEEEEELVRIVFSRGDGWIAWAGGRRSDRPIASFAGIARQGLSALGGFGAAQAPQATGERLERPALGRSTGT